MKARLGRLVERAQAERQRHESVDVLFDMADRDLEAGGGIIAGALAYRLFLWLLEKHGHVSWERVASGMGLANIYAFLGGGEATAAQIGALADGGDELALQAFAVFVDIYGAEAGNMALRLLSRGGVYLAGGIAAKNVEHFTDGRFMTAFLRKGRFHDVMAAMPVRLITNEKVGLLGAVEMARRIALSSRA